MGGEDGDTQATLQEFRHATPSYFLSDQYASAWRPALRRLVLARLAAQVDAVRRTCGVRGGAVVIKEPNGSIGADFVMSLLPRSRMIFLLRDGRDVVDSMVDAQMPGGWLASPVASRAAPVRADRLALVRRESHLWLARTRAVKRAFDAHPEDCGASCATRTRAGTPTPCCGSSSDSSACGARPPGAPTRCAGTTSTPSRPRPRGPASRCAPPHPVCGARTSPRPSRRRWRRSWARSWLSWATMPARQL